MAPTGLLIASWGARNMVCALGAFAQTTVVQCIFDDGKRTKVGPMTTKMLIVLRVCLGDALFEIGFPPSLVLHSNLS